MSAAPQVWLRNAIESAASIEAHPKAAPEGLAPPYAIYDRASTSREQLVSDTLDSPAAGTEQPPVCSITVEVYADDYVAVWDLAGLIVAAVHGYAGPASGATIESCLVIDERDGEPAYMDGRDTPTHVVEQTIEIRWTE